MKNIKEQFANLISKNAKTNWIKGVYIAIIASFFLFLLANIYLLFRPVSKEIKEIIDSEVKSTNINFDQKTLDGLKTKQRLDTPAQTPTGKNPFIPL